MWKWIYKCIMDSKGVSTPQHWVFDKVHTWVPFCSYFLLLIWMWQFHTTELTFCSIEKEVGCNHLQGKVVSYSRKTQIIKYTDKLIITMLSYSNNVTYLRIVFDCTLHSKHTQKLQGLHPLQCSVSSILFLC